MKATPVPDITHFVNYLIPIGSCYFSSTSIVNVSGNEHVQVEFSHKDLIETILFKSI